MYNLYKKFLCQDTVFPMRGLGYLEWTYQNGHYSIFCIHALKMQKNVNQNHTAFDSLWCVFLTGQSLGEFLFLLFIFLLLSSAFCLLVLLTPFYLDQTVHKSFQFGLAWFSLTQLNSAWPSLAQLGSSWLSFALLLFYFIIEWNFKPQLGAF